MAEDRTSQIKKMGIAFKTLRKDRGYAIRDVGDKIVSASNLRKFEEGLIDISATRLIYLLGRMHVSFAEFVNFVDPNLDTEYSVFLTKVSSLYYKNDQKTLESVIENEAKKYFNSQDEFYLITEATAAALRKNIDHSYVVETSLARQVSDYLMRVEIWGGFQISVFGNCLAIINSETIKTITREFTKRISRLKSSSNNYTEFLLSLVNAVGTMTDRGHFDYARELINFISSLDIPQIDLIFNFKLSFFKNLLFLEKKQALLQNDKLIESLILMNLDQTAAAYREYLNNFYKPNQHA
ncbi:Rgg/GadR/MutR family transcriptional regulator [Oenococcus kitaharae]|uniref:MutR family transcriptional regulator n=1 Tax=Oenococcus kitaharae DSM 17330 TaxID=1045004 RepID=G9WJ69_9LACO|nr:Rgg/GadR/MutR family transcriptional regulator [Oenococcus kitaharae]EHN58518.1 MutR family transcriptional regulator [Oenococcus kitaharae DSM 17330]OEY81336.1 hypothetical protein NT95_07380 [Oenococcus kitaharae]OEY82824.1 hypothetical protein NV75_05480 [Oenococcus kitaharae]OEY84632.1 hypothetical protein NT96_05155 [Oenococcus kitaharae]